MMDFMLPLPLRKPDALLAHGQTILSIGSCFTEHIGTALQEAKFDLLQNPSGILFDPAAVCNNLIAYLRNDALAETDVFYRNELWQSWHHHSRFSGTNKHEVLKKLEATQATAHAFLKDARWLLITLGSSFSYRLTSAGAAASGHPIGLAVANCHRAPAHWFQKQLMPIDETISTLDNTLYQLFRFNPALRVIFTISPVRHIRDGVVENNRSKARLLEAVHHLVQKFDKLYYFPAYELVIDVLRDYRFYDVDLVHPNYAATQFVLDHFLKTHTSEDTQILIAELKKLSAARKHRAQHPNTTAHQTFLATHLQRARQLQQTHPYLNLYEEIQYFSQSGSDANTE